MLLRLLRRFAISKLPFTVFVLLVIWSEYWLTDDDLQSILLLVSVPAIPAFFSAILSSKNYAKYFVLYCRYNWACGFMWVKWIWKYCFILFVCKVERLIQGYLPADILNPVYIKIVLSIIVLSWYFDVHSVIKRKLTKVISK